MSLNPYFIGLPILISIREYVKQLEIVAQGLNPYFIGLPILIWEYSF